MPPARTGYSAAQIALHWVIAVLVVAQVVLHEGMRPTGKRKAAPRRRRRRA